MEWYLQSRGRCCEDGLEVLQCLLCSVKQGSRFQRPFMDPEREKICLVRTLQDGTQSKCRLLTAKASRRANKRRTWSCAWPLCEVVPEGHMVNRLGS